MSFEAQNAPFPGFFLWNMAENRPSLLHLEVPDHHVHHRNVLHETYHGLIHGHIARLVQRHQVTHVEGPRPALKRALLFRGACRARASTS